MLIFERIWMNDVDVNSWGLQWFFMDFDLYGSYWRVQKRVPPHACTDQGPQPILQRLLKLENIQSWSIMVLYIMLISCFCLLFWVLKMYKYLLVRQCASYSCQFMPVPFSCHFVLFLFSVVALVRWIEISRIFSVSTRSEMESHLCWDSERKRKNDSLAISQAGILPCIIMPN